MYFLNDFIVMTSDCGHLCIRLTDLTEKAEVAILVLGANSIKGHVVLRVPATENTSNTQ
jgi:hypothetical protein